MGNPMTDGMVICKMCQKTIRDVPGKAGMLFYDVCPECKAGEIPQPPRPESLALTGLPRTAPPTKPSGSFQDLVIQEAAKQIADRILGMLQKAFVSAHREAYIEEAKNPEAGTEAAPCTGAAYVDKSPVSKMQVEKDV